MALLLDFIPLENGGILLLFIIFILLFAKYRNTYWNRVGITQKEPELFFGNCRKLFLKQESFGDTYAEIYRYFKKQNQPFGGIYIALKAELMLLDLDIIKQVLIKDFQHFTDRGIFSDEKVDPLTGNLFSSKGDKWKKMRSRITPTFTSGKMKMMFQILVDTSKQLDNILLEKSQLDEPLDIKDILARFTTDVIGSVAFGIECNSLKEPETEFRKYGQLPFEPKGVDILRQLINLTAPWLFKLLKLPAINKNVTKFFIDLVRETVNYREENNIYRKDFLQLLIQLKNQGRVCDKDEIREKNGTTKGALKSLTIEEMAAQCFVFFLAGFETSSTTMAFCLHELALNSEIQEKVREEIEVVLKKYGGEITYEAILDMTYMEKVIYGRCNFNNYYFFCF